MNRHKIGTSRSSPVIEGNVIRVSLNLVGFRRDRDRISVGVAMGVAMTLGFCGFPALMLYTWVADPPERNITLGIIAAVLSLSLLLTISAATWPALQTAKLLTKTLKEELPALIINQDGIQDYASNAVLGLIPWSEVEAVRATNRYSNRLQRDFPGIAISVKDRNRLLRRRPGLARFRLSDYPPAADGRQIFIPQIRIDAPIEDVVAQIKHFRARTYL